MTQTDNHAMAQAVHDLGSAMWFGGTLMGAAGVNKAGRELSDEYDRIRVAKSAWSRFQPLQWSGIAMSVLAGLQLTRSSAGRLVAQRSFGSVGTLKAGLTALGIASTVYAAYCGSRIGHLADAAQDRDQHIGVADATTSTPQTPPEIARWQRRQRIAQYLVPLLAGANIACGSYLVQSYRPRASARGVLRRLRPD